MIAGGDQADVLLVGGGLANGLAALALRRRHPRLRLTLIEAGAAVGGNHTWSFHGTDLDDDGEALLEPLVERSWTQVAAAFPDHQRRLDTSYHTVRSAGLDRAVRGVLEGRPGSRLLLGARAVRVTAHQVTLDDGRTLSAPLVLDARGPAAPVAHAEGTAYQKFLGLEVELARGGAAWDAELPLVMDARLPQNGAFHFMYVLPFSARRVLVEDTYYADGPGLDRAAMRQRIGDYLAGRGARIGRVLREEEGCLPLPLDGRVAPSLGSPLRLGYQGGWAHPTTGFSLPVAARVATTVARHGVGGAVRGLVALQAWLHRESAFYIRLNRLLFRAVPPDERWRVLSRFYRLPRETIERFYALAATPADRVRVLWGRPPRGLSLRAALLATQAV
jgi:lycopene beta-cyclase